jgi:NTP pyrophosphatase (non-canonical NTP hydrolase)
MDLDSYQDQAMEFAKYQSKLYPFMALSEEAGEVAGKVAKVLRKEGMEGFMAKAGDITGPLYHDLVKELGDVLWQVAACATEMGITLDQIAYRNLEKLHDRQRRGVIVGEGDHR